MGVKFSKRKAWCKSDRPFVFNFTYVYVCLFGELENVFGLIVFILITKTRLFKDIENFTTKKENFQIKNSDIFHITAQNIDYGYSLEPPRRGGSIKYPQSMFLAK